LPSYGFKSLISVYKDNNQLLKAISWEATDMRVLFLVTLIICGALGTAAGGQETDIGASMPENQSAFTAAVPGSGGQQAGLDEEHKQGQEQGQGQHIGDSSWMRNAEDAISATESDSPEQSAATVQPAAFKLDTVCGISLYDSRDDVVVKLGQPSVIDKDEFFADLEVYRYEGLRVAFAGDFIQYVDIDPTHGLDIDGKPVEATREALVKALGEPDYKAEDGIVFQRDEALLKLFLDPQTGKPQAISYYHIATV
jgi:hypothetical protein